MLPLLAHINGVRTKLFSSKPRRKEPTTKINKQLFFDPKLAQTTCFSYNMAEVQDVNLKLSENQLTLKCTTPTPLVLNASPDVTIP